MNRTDLASRVVRSNSFMDFLKDLERFRAMGISRVAPGAVLYNGEQEFNLKGTRIFNPLRTTTDLWLTLTSSSNIKTV